ncbi:thioredoxin domain-containing protein [Methanolobus sp.]|uniref:thioredoxin family protein n=1 Tax=Methanolobus sp. TaxID=1874737 RepID=UPI0025FE6D02|nr:thioredoxin domain-containing protein [Methanolobus sp.]
MSKPELLDFSATWCGPCKMQKPFLEKVKEELGDKVEVKVIDVDQNQELASKYGVQAVPTLVILKDGNPVKRFTGVTTAGVLIEELKKVL